MLIKKQFKIEATLTIRRDDEGKIIDKELRPNIDWEVDPVVEIATNEQIWEDNVMYIISTIVFDENDLQYFLDKGWELIE
jgi:hypothetical protein